MSNNSTTIIVSTEEDGWEYLGHWISMIIQGVVIGGSNLFIVLLILRFKALRNAKEYLVIMCLSLADGIHNLGYIAAGIRRSFLLFTDEYKLQKTPWECMIVSHNLIWLISNPLSGLILFTVSIDRLLSITMPLEYISWSNTYIVASFGSTYMYTLITNFVLGLILAYDVRDETKTVRLPNKCYSQMGMVGMNRYYVMYEQYTGVTFALGSIIAYVLVWVKYRQHNNNKVGPLTNDKQKKQQLTRQRNLSKNLGISCLCTLFVYMIPYSLGYIIIDTYDDYLNPGPQFVLSFLFTLSCCNPLCNVFIYFKRQPEMKQAFKAFFTGKTMPDHLSTWKSNIAAKTHIKRTAH